MTRTLALAALLGGATLITACERKGYDINTDDDDDDDGNDAGDGADGTDPDVDGDGDGYTPLEGDCDDTDASINPDATEVCDGANNDCDGVTDEQDAADVTTWYFDGDDSVLFQRLHDVAHHRAVGVGMQLRPRDFCWIKVGRGCRPPTAANRRRLQRRCKEDEMTALAHHCK